MCLLFGASEWLDGCNTVGFYHHATDVSDMAQGIKDEAQRAAVVQIAERYFARLDAAKTRRYPLGAAALVLGVAMVVLAARGLGGREQARAMLVQVVGVQAALGVLAWFLLADVRAATVEYLRDALALDLAQMRRAHPEGGFATTYDSLVRGFLATYPAFVVGRLAASALVVFALTRSRARAYFETASAPASES
jgi:hypothetical protein